MKKIVLAFLFALPAMAQVSNPSIISVAVAPSGACTAGLPNQQVVTTGVQYSCQNGTWAAINGGSGGSGTVNSGTTGQVAYYPSNGTAVSGSPDFSDIGGPIAGTTKTGVYACDGSTDVTAAIQSDLTAFGDLTITSSSATNTCMIAAPLVMASRHHLYVAKKIMMKEAADADFNMLVNSAYANRATSGVAVTLSWTSGNSVSVAWTAHGLTVGQYVWIRSSTASTYTHYNGVFKVATVTDANDFTFNLDIIPPAGPPGSMVASLADVDESVEGGIWNYDGTTGGTCSGLQCNAIVFGGVENVRIYNLTVTQAEKYSVHIGAARDAEVFNIEDQNTFSDAVKLLGPLHNVRVVSVHGRNGDDQVTFQNDAGPSFPTYAWTEGDISLGYVNNVSMNDSANGTLVGLIACGAEYLGGISIDGVAGITSAQNAALNLTTGCATGAIQSVTAKNVTPSGASAAVFVYPEFYGGTGATLTVSNFDFQGDLSNSTAAVMVGVKAGATITNGTLRLTYNTSPASTTNLFQASCSTGNHCTVNMLNILNSSVVTNFRGRMVDIGPFSTVSQVNIQNMYNSSGANLVTAEATALGTPSIVIGKSFLNVAAVAACAINCNLLLNNSTVNGASGGVLAATGTITMSGYGSGNIFTGGTVNTHTASGSPTFLGGLLTNTIYSAAGTALPTCDSTHNLNAKAIVSDATIPTYLGAYVSGGAIVSPVICNGTGWVTY